MKKITKISVMLCSFILLALLVWVESLSYAFSMKDFEENIVHYGFMIVAVTILWAEYYVFFYKEKKKTKKD